MLTRFGFALASGLMFALLMRLSPTLAQPSGFSVCDGLQGAASGLCRAGVAVGCDLDGSSSACGSIAEQFQQVTGEQPPYAIVTISPTSGPWGSEFTIIDLEHRMVSGDSVVIYESGKDPFIDGLYLAEDVAVSQDGITLTGKIPTTIPFDGRDEVTYLFRVTSMDEYLTSRFGELADLVFTVTFPSGCQPPDC